MDVITELSLAFGWSIQFVSNGIRGLKIISESDIIRASRSINHDKVCACIKDFREDMILLEGLSEAQTREEMVSKGIHGATPDLIYLGGDGPKTIEVSTTLGDPENAYWKKDEIGRRGGRPFDYILIVGLGLDSETYGDWDRLGITTAWQKEVCGIENDFYQSLFGKWTPEAIRDASKDKDVSDPFNILQEMDDLYDEGFTFVEPPWVPKTPQNVEPPVPKVLPEEEDMSTKYYFHTVFPFMTKGLKVKNVDMWKVIESQKVDRILRFGKHGLTKWATDYNIDVQKQLMKDVNKMLDRIVESENDLDYFRKTALELRNIYLGVGAKPKWTGEEVKMTDWGSPVSRGVILLENLAEFWLSKRKEPPTRPTKEEYTAMELETRINDDLDSRWIGVVEKMFHHFAENMTESVFVNDENHPEVLIPMAVPIEDNHKILFGWTLRSAAHWQSKAGGSQTQVIQMYYSMKPLDGLWNCDFVRLTGGAYGYIKCTTVNPDRFKNFIGYDRHLTTLVANVTSYLIGEADTGVQRARKPINNDVMMKIGNETYKAIVAIESMECMNDNQREGIAAIIRNHVFGQNSAKWGWEYGVLSNAKQLEAMDGFGKGPLSELWIRIANKLDVNPTAWYMQ